jgi:hypothetical protein
VIESSPLSNKKEGELEKEKDMSSERFCHIICAGAFVV